ncbi:hypothetical protein OS493_014791 [Desmophyllum pertusum]|uniref:Uncharacterized protein n=1 Tax=Desmophyllum pertusum TaxID=174260 RepID=A0A9X0CET7_9CNID|nr:hypothetical protein OS493_014791 [Desmophyllum pertusum]
MTGGSIVLYKIENRKGSQKTTVGSVSGGQGSWACKKFTVEVSVHKQLLLEANASGSLIAIDDISFVDDHRDTENLQHGIRSLDERDRDRHGGGLAAYVAEHLSHNRLNDSNIIPANVNIEAIRFELYKPKTKKILLGASYRSPNLDASVFVCTALAQSTLCTYTVKL